MSDFESFVDNYYERFVQALQEFDGAPLAGICEILERVRDDGGTVWVAGNGGSAAIADHAVVTPRREATSMAPGHCAPFRSPPTVRC